MDFFEQIKDMAKVAAAKSEEFAKTVGKKAEAAMEMQKLSSEMEKKERFINDNYMQMGMEIYKRASEGEAAPEYLQEYCKLIDTALMEMDELQNKIDLIKQEQFGASPAKVMCSMCGAEVPASSKFCPECGIPMKQEASKEADKNESAPVEDKEQEKAVTDETKSAETVEEVPTESNVDAVAEATQQEDTSPLMAEAQPEQVKNVDGDVNAENVEASSLVDVKAVDVGAEPEDVAPEKAAAEEIIDAEIVEPKADAEKEKKPADK